MSGLYFAKNNTVLTAIPVPPVHFKNVTQLPLPGMYILGRGEYIARDIPIAPLLFRKIGRADEYVLAIITVFILAILSEIAFSILLRRHSARAIHAAYLVDELTHFRNICSHFFVGRRRRHGQTSHRFIHASFLALALALALFAADVLAVVITQPRPIYSNRTQFGVVGVQPVGTSRGRARFIRRTAAERGCTSPLARDALQVRLFLLAGCMHETHHGTGELPSESAHTIRIASWYHRGGNDHNISFEGPFGQGGHTVSIRAQLYRQIPHPNGGTERRVLFNTTDNETELRETVVYLHRVFMYAALEYSCNRNWGADCISVAQAANGDETNRTEEIMVPIRLWPGSNGEVSESVKGWETTFNLDLPGPLKATYSALRVVLTSAIVAEVDYATGTSGINSDDFVLGEDALVMEEGRIAGVALLSLVFIVLVLFMAGLRYVTNPISLALIARQSLARMRGGDAHFGMDDGVTGMTADEAMFSQQGMMGSDDVGMAMALENDIGVAEGVAGDDKMDDGIGAGHEVKSFDEVYCHYSTDYDYDDEASTPSNSRSGRKPRTTLDAHPS